MESSAEGMLRSGWETAHKIGVAAERVLGLGSVRRHTAVASWDVVREALHDLKIGKHELSAEEQAHLARAESEWPLHFALPFGAAALTGVLGSRIGPRQWLLGRSSLLLAVGALGVAVGRERCSAHVEEACAQLGGSRLAAAMLEAREELEREARTRRYEVYDDIFKGVTKR